MYSSIEPKLFEILPNEKNHKTGRLSNRHKIVIKKDYKKLDSLNIEAYVDTFYKRLLLNNEGNFHKGIIGFVSQFGNGKTFFLQYLYCKIFEKLNLRNKKFPIYIDISKFENNSYQNLSLLILSEIIRHLDLLNNSDKKGIEKIKQKFIELFPYALKAISIGSLGALTAGKQEALITAIGEISQEFGMQIIIERNEEERFIKKLKETVSQDNNTSFLVILDNLDRCQPEFVLNLLITLKRLFDIDGMTFLLSYDKQQIINLLHSQYGKNVDIQSYIKKYIAYEYYMPQYTKDIYRFTLSKLTFLNQLREQNNLQEKLEDIFKNQSKHEEEDIDSDNKVFFEKIDEALDTTLAEINFENHKTKIFLAYIWQWIFLNTTLSLRKYEQGFLHINQASSINGAENHVMYILLLYIKFNFPAEYQSILYITDGLMSDDVLSEDFTKEIDSILKNLPYNSANTIKDILKDRKIKNIYQIMEGYPV